MTKKKNLTLKWGTIKGWSGLSENSLAIMKRFFEDGVPMSAMCDHPDDNRVSILCELIDQFEGEIWNDWDGVIMSKDAAKKYVAEYRR